MKKIVKTIILTFTISAMALAQDFELHRPGITPNVSNNPSMVMAERCASMFEKPFEEGWDGVYVMTSK